MLNERISELRTALGLKQNSFAKKLGITAAAMSRIESGERGTSNQLITSICREWNVNENWLRTGDGAMFVELSQAERAARAVASKLKTDNKFILNAFVALGEMSDEEWAVVERFVDALAKKE